MHSPKSRVVRTGNPLGRLLIIAALVLLTVVGAGAYLWFSRTQIEQQQDATATVVAGQQQATAAVIAAATAGAEDEATATVMAREAGLQRRYDAASALEAAGDLIRARSEFQAIVVDEPGFRDVAERLRVVSEKLAESLYQRGVAAADQQLWADAVGAFDEVLAISPGYRDTATRRAAAARELGATATPTRAPTLPPATGAEATATAADPNATPDPAGTSQPRPVVPTPPPTSGEISGTGRNAQVIDPIESEHPYQNDSEVSWTIENNTEFSAARLRFSRIEIEDGVDLIEVRDADDRLIQEISTSHPDGLWTDLVPGAVIKVVLKSDGSGTAWGLRADQIDPANYATLGYSQHPYLNGTSEDITLTNDDLSPAGTRAIFSRIDLEDGVDYLVIKDVNDNPYQWITGSHPEGFTSKAVPGSSIKVQLVSDGSGRRWGYNVAGIETTPADQPDGPPVRGKALAESDHPYANDTQKVLTITNPDVEAVSSKVHFSKIALSHGDIIQVLDAGDTVIQTFGERIQAENIWSDDVPGRVVKIRLITRAGYDDWGYRVDAIVSSVEHPGIVQSDHPYANDQSRVLTLTNPDTSAVSSKIHFARIALSHGDTVQVLDADDTVIQTFGERTQLADVWSDFVPGRLVKVRIISRGGYEDWGFRVDKIVTSVDKPGLAQSDHPYTNDLSKEWTVTNPDVKATSSRVHFTRIALSYGDTVEVLDVDGTVVQTLSERTQLTDMWSDPVPGRVVKIRLTSRGGYEDWGFRVDDVATVK